MKYLNPEDLSIGSLKETQILTFCVHRSPACRTARGQYGASEMLRNGVHFRRKYLSVAGGGAERHHR